MAKKFGGFTPQQQQTLLSKMGYTGPAQQDDLNKFIMANPKAASMLGKAQQMAIARVEGGPQMAMQAGGMSSTTDTDYEYDEQGNIIATTPDTTAPDATTPNVTTPDATTSATTPDVTTSDASATRTPSVSSYQYTSYDDFGMPTISFIDPQAMLNAMPEGIAFPGGSGPSFDAEKGKFVQGDPSMGNYKEYSFDEFAEAYNLNIGDYFISPKDILPIEEEPTLPPEDLVYDPSTGLPDVPEVPETLSNMLEDATGFSGDTKPGFISLVKSGKIPEDPTKYTISGKAEDWTVTFDNGATMKIKVARESKARQRLAEQVIPALNRMKEPDSQLGQAYQEFQGLLDQYDEQVGQYREYQSGEAQKVVDTPAFENVQAGQDEVTRLQALIENYTNQLAAAPEGSSQAEKLKKFIDEENINLNRAKAGLSQARARAAAERDADRKARIEAIEQDPSSAVNRSDVKGFSEDQIEAGIIETGVGDAGTVDTAGLIKAEQTGLASDVERKEAATYDTELATGKVKEVLDKLEAATGKPSDEALAEAQTMSADELSQLGLTAPQIEEAVQVVAPERRKIEQGEIIDEAPSVDQARVEEALMNFEAATGEPSSNATVKGQLTKLMQDFEGGKTPPWAAGAMRSATATLAARGLAASSMAGQAIIQAAMESAIPIATQDARINSDFELQSMSNRQAVAVLKAQQRAEFLGLEFTQDFERRVKNAATISDIANRNFTADVQIALENANIANTVDLANLDTKSAKLLSDAAAMTQVEMESLNNRQQAAMQQAQAFLDFDLREFDADQETSIFKAQSNIQALLTDTAAENARLQFNADSENQVNQFYDKIAADIDMFNVAQKDAIEQANAEFANAREQFNAKLKASREEFHASQALIIEQANTKWMQDIATEENKAINEANREEARAKTEMSKAVYEANMQMERDKMAHAVTTANNNADRATQIAVATMQLDGVKERADASEAGAFASAIGGVVAAVIGSVGGKVDNASVTGKG
jgi:hypothetical protein